MAKRLSYKDKRRFLILIAIRDGGNRCLYCKRKLTPRTLIFEHLNGDEYDNDVDNLAFSCQSCNIKKANNDQRIKGLAEYKHEDNMKKFVGEKFPQLEVEEKECESSKEIDINKKSWEITEKYLRDVLMKNISVPYHDTLNSCVYLCKEKTGNGSNNTIRRHIDALSCPIGPFEVTGKGKKKIIIMRNKPPTT